ncbi:MAG: class II fumarate hydratase [Firmicutes bacterium]|nr:class II fumarate hydratase [Bacillota bacterium]
METRIERDSMGEIAVPADKHWGAQTQRSLQNFPIGWEKMPREIITAFARLKKAAAQANRELCPERMTDQKADAIVRACDGIAGGQYDGEFPLAVWQTGSGTQSNMNVNEVIAGIGNEAAGRKLLHPNDDVNMSQSSNDTFPTAMHIAAALMLKDQLLPALDRLKGTFERLEHDNRGIIKSGRTHLQDAVPISFSQEISGWRGMLEVSRRQITAAMEGLGTIAIGGTAVGTGLNCPDGFAGLVAARLSEDTGFAFAESDNKFHALTSADRLVYAHGALKALAADLMKIANDIRWLASGPRCGLGEITIPANEPGSSIMPGKVNPTQCESITMIAVQVMGNDAAVGMAASQGNFQLNVFLPVMAYNFLQSARLLTDGMLSFEERCVSGITANVPKMEENLNRSLMLVTALTPYIGYDKAADVAKTAHRDGISLKEACVKLGYLSGDQFDSYIRPQELI